MANSLKDGWQQPLGVDTSVPPPFLPPSPPIMAYGDSFEAEGPPVPEFLLNDGEDAESETCDDFLVTKVLDCQKGGKFLCGDVSGETKWISRGAVPPMLLYLFLHSLDVTGKVQPTFIDWVADPRVRVPSARTIQKTITALMRKLKLGSVVKVTKKVKHVPKKTKPKPLPTKVAKAHESPPPKRCTWSTMKCRAKAKPK